MSERDTEHSPRIAAWAPAIPALIAALFAIPGLQLPFLADDWADLAYVVHSPIFRRTPFGYFRPLSQATYWLDFKLWGLAPGVSHLVNLILASAVTALVVILVRRYVQNASLAIATGVIFALHPYHIENTAWIAARPEALYCLLFLCAALTYDRWRTTLRGVPIVTLMLFEAALLAKETAVTLPAFLLILGCFDQRRRPTFAEVTRGHMSLWGLALGHFLILRSKALGGPGLDVFSNVGIRWLKNVLAFGVASVVPAHTESIEARPVFWGIASILAVGILLFAAYKNSGEIPRTAWIALPVFLALLGPSVVSFQSRYFLLPSAASSLALAALLRATGSHARAIILGFSIPCWLFFSAEQWVSWIEAGHVSTRLISALVEISRRPGVHEIVVANMPHRVHGAPVNADFDAAVSLSGGGTVIVRKATAIDIPRPYADGLDGSLETAIRYPPPFAEIKLRTPEGRFSRYVWPFRMQQSERIDTEWATIFFDRPDIVTIRITPAAERGRTAYVWTRQGLKMLF